MKLAAIPVALALASAPAFAQAPPEPTAIIKAQAEAMAPLAWMKGRWQGPAWSNEGRGRHDVIQTERIGPFLDGSVMVMEGKAFEKDGRPAAFNAFGTVSYDVAKKAYEMHSYAQGRAGTFPLEVTPNGYAWTVASGPVRIAYRATFDGKVWTETGHMTRPGAPEVQIFEMKLTRLGDTDWPLAGQAKGPAK